MEKKCVAFLDLLGFSNHVRNAQLSAFQMLFSANDVFSSRAYDPPWDACSPQLQPITRRNGIDCIDTFLPMSDSIFVIGHDANVFLDQLSSFLHETFGFFSHAYTKASSEKSPITVCEKHLSLDENRVPKIAEKLMEWFPLVFRGGIDFDDVITYAATGIGLDKKPFQTPNVAGKAVVNAVKLETCGGKGPKLYLSKSFIGQLDPTHLQMVVTDGIKPHYLWPAHELIHAKDFVSDLREQCFDFLAPVFALWQWYHTQDPGVADHYLEFMRLTIASYLYAAYWRGDYDSAVVLLQDFLQERGVSITALSLLHHCKDDGSFSQPHIAFS
jgi:hypothetical protein